MVRLKAGTQDWNGFITPGLKDIGFDYSYIMAATGDRVPCVFVENQRVVNLDPNDPIQVSYAQPFPGEPLGKDHPEMLTVLKPSVNHGHLSSKLVRYRYQIASGNTLLRVMVRLIINLLIRNLVTAKNLSFII